jgi:hypothetical protein
MSSHSDGNFNELLPILIIPGFMSSGLEIKESSINPNWVNKRLWLNLGSLGLSAFYFGSAQKKTDGSKHNQPTSLLDSVDVECVDQETQDQQNYKSAWLTHMMLNSDDLRSDPSGIKVRAIKGLEGVDYLTPGTFTNMVSYVFGPAINAFKKKGYTDKNLKASPYDWRVSPDELEKRDKYFTKTMHMVEKLYKDNGNIPVIVIGHSMGCKCSHYFLNFLAKTKGQAWIDKHIHTYMPIGAPHLGAPKALRSSISGDKMSLDTFLNDEEALVLGRSFGSGPWLLPSELPDGVPATCYIRPHGVLEVSFTHSVDAGPLVESREGFGRPRRYQMQIVARGFHDDAKEEHMVRTPFYTINSELGRDTVTFNDKLSFATNPHPSQGATLQILLQEPGLAAAKKDKEKKKFNLCYCILCVCCICLWPLILACKILKCFTCGAYRSALLAADAIAKSTGSGSTLAFSESIKVPPAVWKGKEVTVKIPMYHAGDYGAQEGAFCCVYAVHPRTIHVFVKFKWHPFNSNKSFRRKCSFICQPSVTAPNLPVKRSGREYQEFAGYDLMEREGLNNTLSFIKEAYDDDDLLPRSYSSEDPPPIKRIHAIYGINLPTEVGAIYTRRDACLSPNRLSSLYSPDKKAHIATNTGYSISGGILMETPRTKQSVDNNRTVSGDGTVPYWSLQHCKTWKSPDRMVTVLELEKAEHREILADPRFHAEVLRYSQFHAKAASANAPSLKDAEC